MRLEYRNLLEAGIQAMERLQDLDGGSLFKDDTFLTYFSREIAANAMVSEIRGESVFMKMAWGLRFYARRVGDMKNRILHEGKFQISKGFWNFMRLFEFRKGKLFEQPH